MADSAVYLLKGYGRIAPDWMRDCFRLFKERQVNIRKLVLMQNGDPTCFSMLEIQFVLMPEEHTAFLAGLEDRLSEQAWVEKTLLPV